MAASSIDKDFVIKDNAAFEQYQSDLKSIEYERGWDSVIKPPFFR